MGVVVARDGGDRELVAVGIEHVELREGDVFLFCTPLVPHISEGELQPPASGIDRSYRQKQQRAPHAAC